MDQETLKIVAIAALAVIVGLATWLLMARHRQRPSTVSLTAKSSAPFRSSETGKLLADFISSSFNVGSDAKSSSERALEQLRRNPDAAIAEINFTYRALPEQSYNARWTLVYAAVKLGHAASVDFLKDIATLPIPPERSTDLCHHSTVGEEIMIRSRAIEGLRALALVGNNEARSALHELLKADSHSIKVEAARALLQLPEPERALVEPLIREALGEKYDSVLNIRTVKPERLHELFALGMKETGPVRATMTKPGTITPGEQQRNIPARKPGKGSPRVTN